MKKALQKENERLRKAISDLNLDKLILQEADRGNFYPPKTMCGLIFPERYTPIRPIRFRDELLNEEIFYTLKEVQILIESGSIH